MFQIFHFLQSVIYRMVFGILNSFSWLFNAVSSEKSCPTAMRFLSVNMKSGQYSFPRLLNPDWSIQIPGAPAVCKNMRGKNVTSKLSLECTLMWGLMEFCWALMVMEWTQCQYYNLVPNIWRAGSCQNMVAQYKTKNVYFGREPLGSWVRVIQLLFDENKIVQNTQQLQFNLYIFYLW